MLNTGIAVLRPTQLEAEQMTFPQLNGLETWTETRPGSKEAASSSVVNTIVSA